MPLRRARRALHRQRERGRTYQPRFAPTQVLASWLGGLLAITLLGLLSAWSHYPLIAAPFGASAVLLFGNPGSPLAQPRNLVLGNLLAASIAVGFVALLGRTPLVMGLAVGLAIAAGQIFRCLHPPAGAVALLGVLMAAPPAFVLVPVLAGSLLLVAVAVVLHRMLRTAPAYPHHWF